MAIAYHVYANDGRGGLVDYGTPVAITTGLTFVIGPLAAPSDNTYAVRAFDVASGIEEANTDARVRVIIDADGVDISARPNAVVGLSARPTAGGTCWVSWGYDATGQGDSPSGFVVTASDGAGPAPSSPAATVDSLPGVAGYGCTLSGLAANTAYTIAVRPVGASKGLPGLAATVPLDYRATPLSNVDCLVAIPTA